MLNIFFSFFCYYQYFSNIVKEKVGIYKNVVVINDVII